MSNLHADEAFLGHYQFTHDPFAARVPGFKFFPAQRKPVLGQLHHLARYSQLLLVVSGPEGSGKTLLRQALAASTKKEAVHCVVISAQNGGDVRTVLAQVAKGVGADSQTPAAILEQAAEVRLAGQEVYILVDDAEALATPALEALLELAGGTEKERLHVFLFGEAEVVMRLEDIAQGEERYHAIELLPYSESEAEEYLAQRLEGAGQGLEIFTDEQLATIHERSGGWPGRLNEEARDVLVAGMSARRKKAAAPAKGSRNLLAALPRKHLIILGVVVVAVGAAALSLKGGKSEAPTTANEQNLPLGGQSTAGTSTDAQGAPIQFDGSSKPLPLPLVGDSQPVIREPLAEAAGGRQAGTAAGNDMEAGGVPPTVSTEAPPVSDEDELPSRTPARSSAPSAPAVTAPAPRHTAPAAPTPAPTKPAPAAAPAHSAGTAAGWYGSQSGSKYALQVVGTSTEKAAQDFIARQTDSGSFHYFKKSYQGKALYVVTYGSFANRAAAEAAAKQLPAKVQASKPWPRTFASIQQDIATSR
ncbi:MAG TPA: cell division protein [Pseudomonas sp.]|nr:cell division protein [Pseudomonas sp.]